jgi:prepilin-type N-terminal cleavage/methylation domain-containing protein
MHFPPLQSKPYESYGYAPEAAGRKRPRLRSRSRTAFTLVEMLVVVAIIGILVALLMPALQSAREAARRSVCSNNLKQIALAVESHKTSLGHFPTGGWSSNWIGSPDRGADWRQPGGWCFTILPYLDAVNLYNGTASDLATTNVPAFACPSRRGSGLVTRAVSFSGTAAINAAAAWMHSDYAGNRGSWSSSASLTSSVTDRATTFMPLSVYSGTNAYPSDTAGLRAVQDGMALVAGTGALNASQPFPLDTPLVSGSVPTGGVIFAGSALPPALVRDGFANTYLVGEKYVPQAAYATGDAAGDSQCAYVGDSPDILRGGHRPPEPDSSVYAANFEGGFGGPHPGVFVMTMCDGSVRTFDFSINAQVHFLLACRGDRQVFTMPD